MNTQIVQISGQKAFTNSLVIADSCNIQHKNILSLIKKHKVYFEDHGSLAFQTRPFDTIGGQQNREIVDLNEDQATFLITLLRNTDIVLKFKSALVKAFRKAIDEINRLYANPPRDGILSDKRKAHDPMMDALIDFRLDSGKETNKNHFMCENKLCNSIITGKYTGIDESTLSNKDADLLTQIRAMNENLIKAGIDYSERKAMLQRFGMRYKTKLIA